MSNLLVTGAGGHLGSLIVTHLLAAHSGDTIIAGSRDPAKLSDLAAKGAQTRKVDFDDPNLAESFAGIDRLLIVSSDALDRPGHRLEQHQAAIAAAQKAGVRHVVYTSMPKPDASAVTFAPDHLGTENALKASGLAYTILRNAWYMENLVMGLSPAVASGALYSSAADGKISHVARDDLAQAAAAALLKAPVNQTFTLTGPELHTTAGIAALASEVLGKPIHVVDLNDEQLAGGMKAAGVPEFLIPMLVSFDTTTRTGGFDILTGDVASLTGKAPQTLRDFLIANKAAFAGG